jgi:hypothetical protein
MLNDERRTAQRGEGKFGGILSLAAFLAFCYAVWNVAPIYMANYSLGDKMIEVCRLHPGTKTDDAIKDLLMRYVREQDLTPYVSKESFKIQTRDSARKITLEYEREGKILPGWTRTFHFRHEVDQPFF